MLAVTLRHPSNVEHRGGRRGDFWDRESPEVKTLLVNFPEKDRREMDVRLTLNRVAILKDLEPKKHWNYLIQEGVLDYDDLEELKAEKTRKARGELLIEKVLRAGRQNVDVFMNSLSIYQRHLYELLQRDLPERPRRQQGNYIESGWQLY